MFVISIVFVFVLYMLFLLSAVRFICCVFMFGMSIVVVVVVVGVVVVVVVVFVCFCCIYIVSSVLYCAFLCSAVPIGTWVVLSDFIRSMRCFFERRAARVCLRAIAGRASGACA
jgi:hypothetical protein